MDFGLRELLFFIGIVFIAGILFDGLRRMRKSKGELYGLPPDYDQIEVGRNGPDEPQLDRVGQSADVIDLRTDAQRAASQRGVAIEQGRGADEMVQQSRSGPRNNKKGNSKDNSGPSRDFEEEYGDELPNGGARRVSGHASQVESEGAHVAEPNQGEPVSESRIAQAAHAAGERQARRDEHEPTVSLGRVRLEGVVDHSVDQDVPIKVDADSIHADPTHDTIQNDAIQQSDPTQEERLASSTVSDVIVFNIIAKDKGSFSGPSLLKAAEMCQMTLGEMNIFHRYEGNSSEALFSMANLVEPGTFDLDTLHDFKSPGVCLFMQLPGPKRSIVALERMVEVARKLAIKLGAEMRDENHSVITPQTIEHYRQRVMEFERKRRTRRHSELAH